jgi:NADPH:quinone reductase-like Zn-dependent oxidoreductase
MKAIVYGNYGAPDVLHLKDVDKPSCGDDDVLVKVYASSVTTGDSNVRGFVFVPPGFKLLSRLMFGLTKPRKQILGIEFAGEIASVGKNVTSFKVGDAVFGIDGNGLGAYAEYKCIPEASGIAHKPDNLTYEEAVVIPNGALTALTFLKNMGKVQTGHKVLINGASGSVGSAAVQIARALGAEVTGVCSTGNVELVKSLGADTVIDYTKEDFTQNGQTYDFIMDTVGKTSFDACKNSLNPNGGYLASGGGLKEMIQALWTSITGGKKVFAGISSESKDDLIFIKGLVEAGKLKPVIDRCYPMEQIVEAHRYVDQGHKKGNVVITIVPDNA